jgi:hypothetical protein
MDRAPVEKMTRLVLCNLDDGRTLERFGPGKMIPLAVSDNGNQVLLRDDIFSPQRKDCLEIWTVTRSGLEQTLQWYPKGDGRSGGRDIQWGAFLSEGRLATFGDWGMLVIWQLDPLKPLYYLKLGGSCNPVLSPDQQYLVCAAEGQLGVIDPKLGKLLAVRPLPDSGATALAFSPSGLRLGGLGSNCLTIWDFSTGELQHKAHLTGFAGGNGFFWTSEQHVLMGGSILFDVEGQLKLWHYESVNAAAYGDGVCWLVTRQNADRAGALLALDLPHDEAKQRLKEAAADPKFYVFRPDVTVRLNLDGLPDAAARDKVRTVLTGKLRANGCYVGPKGTIDLVANIKQDPPQPESRERHLMAPLPPRPFGPFGPRGPFFRDSEPEQETPPPPQGTCSLQLVYEGQTVWEASRWGPLDGSEYIWFIAVKLPEHASKGGTSEALGSSEVTPSGLRDTSRGVRP